MTRGQAMAASKLELSIPEAVRTIGETHSALILLDAIVQANFSVDDLRFLSRMLDRRADNIEREARDADR